MQHAPKAQKEGDQETAHAPVAIKEGMDRLELRVRKGAVDQYRKFALLMKESLEGSQGLVHFLDRRRDIDGLSQRCPLWADPVLGSPKLTRGPFSASHTSQQLPVDLSDQTERQRKCA